jgi:hypothetical protein
VIAAGIFTLVHEIMTQEEDHIYARENPEKHEELASVAKSEFTKL